MGSSLVVEERGKLMSGSEGIPTLRAAGGGLTRTDAATSVFWRVYVPRVQRQRRLSLSTGLDGI